MALPNVFSPGQVFTAANANLLRSNQYNQTVTNKTASYTPTTTTDIGTRVIMNSASATTITINTSIYSAGDTFFIGNIGVGVCTVTAGTCTITTAGSLAIPQNGGGTLYFTSASAAIFYPSAGPTASSGLTLISVTTTNAAQMIIANCFSSTYENYLVVASGILGVGDGVGMQVRFGASGTPTTSSTYYVSDAKDAGGLGNKIEVNTAGSSTPLGFTMNIFAPNVANLTMFTHYSHNMSASNTGRFSNGQQTDSTQFTDLVVRVPSTSFTSGTVRVYGYANS